MIDLTCFLHNNTLSVGTVLIANFCLPTESSHSQFPVRRKRFLKWLNNLCVPGDTQSTHFPWRREAHGEQRFPPWLLKSFSQTPGGAIANPLRRHGRTETPSVSSQWDRTTRHDWLLCGRPTLCVHTGNNQHPEELGAFETSRVTLCEPRSASQFIV